jgi:hypothetical protein
MCVESPAIFESVVMHIKVVHVTVSTGSNYEHDGA